MDANVFVSQEDDDNQTYSIRAAGFDLLSVRHPVAGDYMLRLAPDAILVVVSLD